MCGNGQGGIFGSGAAVEAMVANNVEPTAYTTEEFLRGLMLDPYILAEFAKKEIDKYSKV